MQSSNSALTLNRPCHLIKVDNLAGIYSKQTILLIIPRMAHQSVSLAESIGRDSSSSLPRSDKVQQMDCLICALPVIMVSCSVAFPGRQPARLTGPPPTNHSWKEEQHF